MRTYYLFINDTYDIDHVFDNLLETRVIEPGISYIRIQQDHTLLPPHIVIESVYKDDFLTKCLTTLLSDMDYEGDFDILKPLSMFDCI